jgi:hypothetical protein
MPILPVNSVVDDELAPQPPYHLRLPRPRVARDLFLAPVAAAIDRNLQDLRDLPVDELRPKLDGLDHPVTHDERVLCLLRAALWDVNTHEWSTEITADGARLRLSGGSVSLDIGLSPSLIRYVQTANGG